jgi:hypothetical protein
MEAICSSERLVFLSKATLCHIPEENTLKTLLLALVPELVRKALTSLSRLSSRQELV